MRRPLRFALALTAAAALRAGPAPAQEPATEPATEPAAEPEVEPLDTGDLPRILQRKELRVIVSASGEEFLPRKGRPESLDRDLALELGRRLGVEVRFVLVEAHDKLLDALVEGRGDIVAAQLTVTKDRSKRVAFTRPTATVKEWVVGRQGAKNLPRAPKGLAGREVHVRPSSSYAESLRALGAAAPGLKIVPIDEKLDTNSIVEEVADGKRPLTVVDSHILEVIESYDERVKRLFPIADARQIAWAVRKDNPKLKSAADALIIEKALTGHTEERFTGDLAGIKKRGVLRVITRNNPVTYFLYRGEQFGFDYELARLAAETLGVRLEMVVPPSRDLLVPWLLEGRADVIAASFTVTPERRKQVAFSEPYLFVDEVLVQRAAGPRLASPAELKGTEIHVRKSSSYFTTLARLQEKYGPFTIVEAPEDQETEELVARVAAGEIPFTVADSHILEVEMTYRDDIEGAFVLPAPGAAGPAGASQSIAFAVRPRAKKLRAFLDGFVKRTYRSLEYNMLQTRYFKDKRRIARAKDKSVAETGRLSPYDALLKKYSTIYGLDWRLMAAQAYQESRFDPDAKSWVGAVGLFQVMPVTGKELGFTNLARPEQGIHAGIRYMHRLINQFDPEMPFKQRVRFALAAYNVGRGHVLDAMRLAEKKKLDPARWFGNVEKAMLLLARPEHFRRSRHGYCRGEEPVKYVSEIQNRYDNYVKMLPQ